MIFFPKDRIFHFFCLLFADLNDQPLWNIKTFLLLLNKTLSTMGELFEIYYNKCILKYKNVCKVFDKRLHICTIDMDRKQVEARKKSMNCAFYGRNSMVRNTIRSTRKR